MPLHPERQVDEVSEQVEQVERVRNRIVNKSAPQGWIAALHRVSPQGWSVDSAGSLGQLNRSWRSKEPDCSAVVGGPQLSIAAPNQSASTGLDCSTFGPWCPPHITVLSSGWVVILKRDKAAQVVAAATVTGVRLTRSRQLRQVAPNPMGARGNSRSAKCVEIKECAGTNEHTRQLKECTGQLKECQSLLMGQRC